MGIVPGQDLAQESSGVKSKVDTRALGTWPPTPRGLSFAYVLSDLDECPVTEEALLPRRACDEALRFLGTGAHPVTLGPVKDPRANLSTRVVPT